MQEVVWEKPEPEVAEHNNLVGPAVSSEERESRAGAAICRGVVDKLLRHLEEWSPGIRLISILSISVR